MKPSGIGGQAVIEGVMMKNQDVYAVAIRKPDKKIEIKNEKCTSIQKRFPLLGAPIIRGVVSFVESMLIGMKTLTYSASFYEEEEQKKPNKMEEKMGSGIVMGFTVFFSIILAIGIFMVLPFFIAEFFKKVIHNVTILALIEGLIRVTIFIAYIVAISFMEDIKRVFMYHGAEHKTINCLENGFPLTIKNVKRQSRYHKRCGTSFLFVVMFISIIFFILVKFENIWIRMGCRIVLIPIIAGISYEFIKFAGRNEGKLVTILSKPGMWLQALTTKEPDDSMIEVAIASVEAIFDWKKYQTEEKEDQKVREKAKKELVAMAEIVNRRVKEKSTKVDKNKTEAKNTKTKTAEMKIKETKAAETKKAETKATEIKAVEKKVAETKKNENANTISEVKVVKKAENSRMAMEKRIAREKTMAEKESHHLVVDILDDEEEDEILRALDKFFVYDKENNKP